MQQGDVLGVTALEALLATGHWEIQKKSQEQFFLHRPGGHLGSVD